DCPPPPTLFPYTTLFRSTLLARTSPKPVQNLNNEFFNIGGPVIKDKLFFFGAWEHVTRDLPVSVGVSSATIATLGLPTNFADARSEEHTSELQSRVDLVC